MDGNTQAKSQNVICEVEGLFQIMTNVDFYNTTLLRENKICFLDFEIDRVVGKEQEIGSVKWIRE